MINFFKASSTYWLVIFLFFAPFAASSSDESIRENFKIIQLSPPDHTVIIKSSENQFSVLKIGDSFRDLGVLKQITDERVLLEKKDAEGIQLTIIRLKAGKQQMEKITKFGKGESALYAPGGGNIQ